MAGAAVCAAVGLAPSGMGCGSDSGGTECECEDPSVHIEVPADRAPYALGVTFSGRGCATATAECTQPAGSGCAEYTFQGTGIGTCDLDLQFSAAPYDFQDQVSFVGATCCPSFYIDPPTAAPIQVPDVSGDAGDAE